MFFHLQVWVYGPVEYCLRKYASQLLGLEIQDTIIFLTFPVQDFSGILSISLHFYLFSQSVCGKENTVRPHRELFHQVFSTQMRILYFKSSFCFYLHVCDYICVCVFVHLSVGDEGGRRGHQVPWDWRSTWLCAICSGCWETHSGAHAVELCLV